MPGIDKVMYFLKGLVMDIKQEVKLRRFRATTEAISFALMYDRTHHALSHSQGRYGNLSSQRRSNSQLQPRIEEKPTSMELGSARIVSREQCMRRNLCFYCMEPGHCLVEYRKRQVRNTQRGASFSQQTRNSFRASQGSFCNGPTLCPLLRLTR
ncbi:hypothetical protein PI124_g14990 [Phytophthora idaei]|nr:hypothetical protein PI126_g13895 [Phytophthora idaei]KAG3240111.1 hypothetical protein PI124_g14990 [Phytophthora idaei]